MTRILRLQGLLYNIFKKNATTLFKKRIFDDVAVKQIIHITFFLNIKKIHSKTP